MPNPQIRKSTIIDNSRSSNGPFTNQISGGQKTTNLKFSPSTIAYLQRQEKLREFIDQQQDREFQQKAQNPSFWDPYGDLTFSQYFHDMRRELKNKEGASKDPMGIIILKKTADINAVSGFAGGGVELTNTISSIGTNLKIYRSGWMGNQYVSDIKVLKLSKSVGQFT